MDVSQFYSRRQRTVSRYIVSAGIPDDGNVSDTGGTGENTDSDDSDTLYQLADDTTDSEGANTTDDDGENGDVSDEVPEDTDQWSTTSHAPFPQPVFNKDSGPFIVLSQDAKPIDYFSLLFPDSLWTELVTETNRYGQSKPGAQKATDKPEMKAFIALTLAMAIHKLPQVKNYWSSDWVLAVPQFRQIFTRDRYWFLFSNIHLVDNANALPRDDPQHDRLFKVRPLIKRLNETFSEHYSPSQNLSVDESMVRFKGRSTLKQYLPMKPIKRGFKVWCLSCSCCGYLLQFQVYTGKDAEQSVGLAHRVVTDLVCPIYSNANFVVFMDNFFSSLPLFEELQQDGIFACGTYRSNRAGFPKELNDSTRLKQLSRGDALFLHKANTTAVVWMDRKPVHVVSNCHKPTISTVQRKNRDGTIITVNCPTIIQAYNRHMGGVDFSDQMKVYYSYNRKSKRWWVRLFFHFIDTAVVNAYVLYLHCYKLNMHPPMKYKPMKQLTFRCQLIDELVNHFTCRKQKGPRTAPVVSVTPSGHKIFDMRSVGICPGRCEYCCVGPNKTRKRKETQFGCPKCQKRLCPTDCWVKFHNKMMPQ